MFNLDESNFNISKLTLRFTDQQLEKGFKDYYQHSTLGIIRIFLYFALIAWASFAFLDSIMIPSALKTTLIIRLLLGEPVILAALILSYFPIFSKIYQYLMSFMTIWTGLLIVVMIAIAQEKDLAYFSYTYGLLCIIVPVNTVARLRFKYSLFTSFIILSGYVYVKIFIQHVFQQSHLLSLFIGDLFFLTTVTFFSLVASYSIEYLFRRDFHLRQSLTYQAHHDHLTGVPNRKYFQDMLVELMAKNRKQSKEQFALLMLDIDYFKEANDKFGHAIGDKILIEVSKRIKSVIRKSDYVFRLGGDEFVVILDKVTSEEETQNVVQKIMEEVAKDCYLKEHKLNLSVSIGICLYPQDGETTESILKSADTALYKAKTARNSFTFYKYLANETPS